MTPPSPRSEGSFTSRSLHLHIDRRRMVVLGAAGGFLLVAIVFGALAYFQTVPTPGGSTNISVPFTTPVTVTPSAAASSPAGGARRPAAAAGGGATHRSPRRRRPPRPTRLTRLCYRALCYTARCYRALCYR